MSDDELPEPFELHGACPVASDLASRAWMFVRKHHERLDEEFRAEKAVLLESAAGMNRTAETAARALGLLSHEIGRAREREAAAGVEELRHLSIKAEDALRSAGVRLEDPTGQTLAGPLLGRCQVLDNLPRPGVGEHVVGETLTPTILLGPKVIHLAEVIGWIPDGDLP